MRRVWSIAIAASRSAWESSTPETLAQSEPRRTIGSILTRDNQGALDGQEAPALGMLRTPCLPASPDAAGSNSPNTPVREGRPGGGDHALDGALRRRGAPSRHPRRDGDLGERRGVCVIATPSIGAPVGRSSARDARRGRSRVGRMPSVPGYTRSAYRSGVLRIGCSFVGRGQRISA